MQACAQNDNEVEITVKSRSDVDTQLETNLAVLVERAFAHRNGGILVTRHSHNKFTLALDPKVPFGQTIEVDRR
ncbi:hypothetical protein FDW84_01600 [Pseudarthrobacter sp. NamE5]|nr:hypothetical protein FDW84_01600 [Pseudarthrobacter sp. NamE5]